MVRLSVMNCPAHRFSPTVPRTAMMSGTQSMFGITASYKPVARRAVVGDRVNVFCDDNADWQEGVVCQVNLAPNQVDVLSAHKHSLFDSPTHP